MRDSDSPAGSEELCVREAKDGPERVNEVVVKVFCPDLRDIVYTLLYSIAVYRVVSPGVVEPRNNIRKINLLEIFRFVRRENRERLSVKKRRLEVLRNFQPPPGTFFPLFFFFVECRGWKVKGKKLYFFLNFIESPKCQVNGGHQKPNPKPPEKKRKSRRTECGGRFSVIKGKKLRCYRIFCFLRLSLCQFAGSDLYRKGLRVKKGRLIARPLPQRDLQLEGDASLGHFFG